MLPWHGPSLLLRRANTWKQDSTSYGLSLEGSYTSWLDRKNKRTRSYERVLPTLFSHASYADLTYRKPCLSHLFDLIAQAL